MKRTKRKGRNAMRRTLIWVLTVEGPFVFDIGASVALQQSLQGISTPDGEPRRELMSNINFARNFADDILLPYGVEQVVYLDVDTIVQVGTRRPQYFLPACVL
eukprot:scaffold351307_cov38-Prasinocladus_malaysianus.AAC.1